MRAPVAGLLPGAAHVGFSGGGFKYAPAVGEALARGGYAQGEATTQLTSSAHDVALSKVLDPPSLPM